MKTEKEFMPKIESIRKRRFLAKSKQFFKYIWEFITVLAYVRFYMMCFVGFMLTLVLAMYVLVKEGRDISQLASSIKIVGYSGVAYIAVIMIDKLRNSWKNLEEKKDIRNKKNGKYRKQRNRKH